MKNEVICKEDRISEFVPIEKTLFKEAVLAAFAEEASGPGVTGF
jgi:hypothetical protein